MRKENTLINELLIFCFVIAANDRKCNRAWHTGLDNGHKPNKRFNFKKYKAIKVIKGKMINLINATPETCRQSTLVKLDKLKFPPITIMATAIAASPKILIGF